MTKSFCDICGREFMGEPHRRYKLKREWYEWHESGWEWLDIHDECWRNLCIEIRKAKEKR